MDKYWTCPKCSQRVQTEYEVCWKCGTSVDGVEDPHFFDEARPGEPDELPDTEGETPDSLVTLTKCSLPGQAHAIRMRLEHEGIPVFLFDEFTITMDWLLSNAIGGVKVQVPLPYLERARDILGIVEEEEDLAEDDTEAETEHDDAEGASSVDEEPTPQEGIVDLERQEGVTDLDKEAES